MEDWTKVVEGNALHLQFETSVPPESKKVLWSLEIFPKGIPLPEGEKKEVNVKLGLEFCEGDFDALDDMAQFQIETAYRIRKSVATDPLDMSKSRSLSSIHSSMFRGYPFNWLKESYEVGTVEDRAVDGFLTLDFEIRTYSTPKMKFQFSMDKQTFVNNFEGLQLASGDVKIFCGGKEFSCHKMLLTSQSPVFKAMFDQVDSKESRENTVDIQDCIPEAVEEFLFFLYNAMLRPFRFTPADLELMFGLVHLSTKYQVGLLVCSCMDVLMDIMDVNNVLRIKVVVDKYQLGSLISNMVCGFMKKNIAIIVDKEEWNDFFNEYPTLVKDFILDMNKEMVDTKEALKNADSCSTCGNEDIICATCNANE